VDAGVTTDIDGDPRLGTPDLGADEYYPRSTLKVTKEANRNSVLPGAVLSYTLRVTNSGNVTLTATVTDFLPGPVTPSGVLTWTLLLTTPGSAWTEQFTVTVEMDYVGPLTNAVQVTAREGATGYAEAFIVVVRRSVYLPLVLRQYQ